MKPVEDIREKIEAIVGIEHDEQCWFNYGKDCKGCLSSSVSKDDIEELCNLFSTILDGLVMEERWVSDELESGTGEYIEAQDQIIGFNEAVRELSSKISTIQKSLKGETYERN
jgi:hypothetical protein